MLLQLNITNFALIENLSISFDKGFNVLSGETGAGKSILIDAINYVLGGKFNKDLIRTGEDRTYVEAVFSIENEKTIETLKELEIDYEDIVIISRETFQSGKSIAKVNGKSLILSNIKQISSNLLDIHGQHENQNLLEPSNHIYYLDYFCGNKINPILNSYKEEFDKINEINSKIVELQGKDGEREKQIDFLKYQIEELNKMHLKINEDTELEEQFLILSNSEKIKNVLTSSYETLYKGKEDNSSIYDELGMILKNLRTIEKYSDKISKIANSIEEVYYSIEQNVSDIRNINDSIFYDEVELENINSRIFQISNMKKKYGKEIKDILEYKGRIEVQYDELINSNEIIEKLIKDKEIFLNNLKAKVEIIRKIRIDIAIELESRVKKELNYIGLEKSVFKIEISDLENYNENGGDKVQFCISTNPGEPLKPLEKVVSGGELSRIMLALKTVFIDKDKIPSVIFDEIDTGISGRIAQSVGEKMYLLSNTHQVFCVTHLPQIACMSDGHYLISKESNDGKTYTHVLMMNNEQKQYEVARMIGGTEVTKLTLAHAEELVSIANNKKIELLNREHSKI